MFPDLFTWQRVILGTGPGFASWGNWNKGLLCEICALTRTCPWMWSEEACFFFFFFSLLVCSDSAFTGGELSDCELLKCSVCCEMSPSVVFKSVSVSSGEEPTCVGSLRGTASSTMNLVPPDDSSCLLSTKQTCFCKDIFVILDRALECYTTGEIWGRFTTKRGFKMFTSLLSKHKSGLISRLNQV